MALMVRCVCGILNWKTVRGRTNARSFGFLVFRRV